ncbi:hypothetical protein HUT19_41120 [Streptomyces sp. NA02950]|uniref:hypothetical protein n=1 Tax=Streptomyces sp. NA02950 TaxID=2742137 RepID=UPI001590AC27|nr:hypothetical protein [Streptomyces sp. NA02950]QKV90383.1 hypothetical protein HUT19_00100 [Streptomyces sp. NA02950]QKV97284.1 hypothetical protein HUT19_41120 [Streptomyces sp. NA02950]
MNPTEPQPSAVSHPVSRAAYLADHLEPTQSALAEAAQAVATTTAAGWHPLTGYPGRDEPWQMRCLLCGWEGPRTYSQVLCSLPNFRHPGCIPQSQWTDKLAQLVSAGCRCVIAHPTTPSEAADVVEGIRYARQVGDGTGLLLGLARLLGPCPASANRAHALAQSSR